MSNLHDKYWYKYKNIFDAVLHDRLYLQLTSNKMQDNFYIVFEAVKNNGYALEYASNELKNNSPPKVGVYASVAGYKEVAASRKSS